MTAEKFTCFSSLYSPRFLISKWRAIRGEYGKFKGISIWFPFHPEIADVFGFAKRISYISPLFFTFRVFLVFSLLPLDNNAKGNLEDDVVLPRRVRVTRRKPDP